MKRKNGSGFAELAKRWELHEHTRAEDQMNMLELNDDCLLELLKHCTIFDVDSLIKTCTRFQSLGASAVARNKRLSMDFDDRLVNRNLTFDMVEYHFKAYGHLTRSVKLNAWILENRKHLSTLLDLIENCCKPERLRCMYLCGFTIDAAFVTKTQTLMNNLTSLTLYSCYFDNDVTQLLEQCTELKEFIIGDPLPEDLTGARVGIVNALRKMSTNKLETLVLNGMPLDSIGIMDLCEMLQKCTQLKKFHFYCTFVTSFIDMMPYMTNIEDLSCAISHFDNPLRPLNHLENKLEFRHLHKLELKLKYFSYRIELYTSLIERLAELNTVTELKIIYSNLAPETIPEPFIDAFEAFKSLRILKWCNLMAPTNFENFAKKLENLEELHVLKSRFYNSTFINFIEHSKSLQRLYIVKSMNVKFDECTFAALESMCSNRPHRLIILSDRIWESRTTDYNGKHVQFKSIKSLDSCSCSTSYCDNLTFSEYDPCYTCFKSGYRAPMPKFHFSNYERRWLNWC